MDAAKKKADGQASILDLNILPPRYRRRRLSLHTLRLWLMMLAFAGLIYPSHVVYRRADVALKRQELNLAEVQKDLDAYEPLVAEKDELIAQIEEVQEQSLEIETVAENAVIQEVAWSEILQSIVETIPQGIELISIGQLDNEVRVVGLAENRRLPPIFMDDLMETGIFVETRIEYMIQQLPDETESEEVVKSPPTPGYEFEIMLDIGVADDEELP
jgi:Tfp pilus assembly protein PilN